ncbi:hypothetical protein [Planctomycetes bacterium K23_9]|uniref:Uncharacterized protein n=1 Tax=Stieleria marina TaxID=1930275 RepID=A0A517NUE3_9BACT|nr:hypothetical protein K239x_26990 [Planctomycetes bacterium K23_9]
MMHCPHLTHDNQCEVAKQMAGCSVRTTPTACNACQNESNPRAINVVTIGMALVNKKRRKQDVAELQAMLRNYMPDEDPLPQTLKISNYRPGPGNELKKMIAWFAKSSESCNCETRVDTMNDWGAEGCRRNIDTITEWLLEEAQARGLPHGRFTATIARSLVKTAIRKYERKFPEGAPEPDQDDPEDELDR